MQGKREILVFATTGRVYSFLSSKPDLVDLNRIQFGVVMKSTRKYVVPMADAICNPPAILRTRLCFDVWAFFCYKACCCRAVLTCSPWLSYSCPLAILIHLQDIRCWPQTGSNKLTMWLWPSAFDSLSLMAVLKLVRHFIDSYGSLFSQQLCDLEFWRLLTVAAPDVSYTVHVFGGGTV